VAAKVAPLPGPIGDEAGGSAGMARRFLAYSPYGSE
jgi:hypothetical protein